MKRTNIIILVLVVLIGGLSLLMYLDRKMLDETSSQTMPSGIGKYYQNSSSGEDVAEVTTKSDLDSLEKDLDSISLDSINSDINALDKDIASF